MIWLFTFGKYTYSMHYKIYFFWLKNKLSYSISYLKNNWVAKNWSKNVQVKYCLPSFQDFWVNKELFWYFLSNLKYVFKIPNLYKMKQYTERIHSSNLYYLAPSKQKLGRGTLQDWHVLCSTPGLYFLQSEPQIILQTISLFFLTSDLIIETIPLKRIGFWSLNVFAPSLGSIIIYTFGLIPIHCVLIAHSKCHILKCLHV